MCVCVCARASFACDAERTRMYFYKHVYPRQTNFYGCMILFLKKLSFLDDFLPCSLRSLTVSPIATGGTFPRYPMKLVTRRTIDVSVV